MKFLTVFLALLLSTSFLVEASSPKDDKKKTDETNSGVSQFREGIVYALPRTGINIKVKARKVSFNPGPYSQFAEKYLGIIGVKTTESTTWELTALNVGAFFEADQNAVFKAMDTVATLVSQLPNGVIAGINSSGVCSSTNLTGSDFMVTEKVPLLAFTDLSSSDFYEVFVDAATGTEKTEYKSLDQKARDAADYLMRLRKKRSYAILNPNDVVPEDGKGYEVFVNEAQRLEKEYVALFTGKEFSSEHEFNFIFIPGENSVKNEVLFRFSAEKGVLPKNDIAGKPILLELIKEETAFTSVDNLKKSDNPNAGSSGIYYRVPCVASLKLSDGLNTLYAGRMAINQFGVVLPLPERLLNGGYQIQYNTETGSLKNVSQLNR